MLTHFPHWLQSLAVLAGSSPPCAFQQPGNMSWRHLSQYSSVMAADPNRDTVLSFNLLLLQNWGDRAGHEF